MNRSKGLLGIAVLVVTFAFSYTAGKWALETALSHNAVHYTPEQVASLPVATSQSYVEARALLALQIERIDAGRAHLASRSSSASGLGR